MLKSKWNSYFSFEDASIQTNVEPISADEIQEVTQNEIDVNNEMTALEENTQIMDELIEQNDEITEVVESSPASVTPEVVQEHNTRFLIALGRLGAGTNDLSNIKIGTESSSLPLQQLKVTQEGIIDTIKEFFAKIWNFIKDIFTKIINWFKNLFGVTKKKEDKIASVDEQIKKAGININKAKKEVDELVKDPEVKKIIEDAEKTAKEDTKKLLKEKLSKPGRTDKLKWKDDSKTEDSNVVKKAEAFASFAAYLASTPLANNTINFLLAIFGQKINLNAVVDFGAQTAAMYEELARNDAYGILKARILIDKLVDNAFVKNIKKLGVNLDTGEKILNINLDTREPSIECFKFHDDMDIMTRTIDLEDKLKQTDVMYGIMVVTDVTFIQNVIKAAKQNQFSEALKTLTAAAEKANNFYDKRWVNQMVERIDKNASDEERIEIQKELQINAKMFTHLFKALANYSKFVTNTINVILNCEQHTLKMVIEL